MSRMVLSPSELAALDAGRRRTFKVTAHERKVLNRSPQCLKDKKIEDFAVGFVSQLRRHGVTTSDRRHVKNLVTLLREELRNG